MRISDWSSDVCSSDLDVRESVDLQRDRRSILRICPSCVAALPGAFPGLPDRPPDLPRAPWPTGPTPRLTACSRACDRRSVVSGQRVAVRVEYGGLRSLKKQQPPEANASEKRN